MGDGHYPYQSPHVLQGSPDNAERILASLFPGTDAAIPQYRCCGLSVRPVRLEHADAGGSVELTG